MAPTQRKNETSAESPSDREIVITRAFDAPRELVWKAWTDPTHVVNWWGPTGFTTTIEAMEVKPGGVWEHVMHGPDGTDYPNRSVFTEVVPFERIRYAHSGAKKGGPGANFQSTWTFEQEGAKTRVTIRMVFDSTEERDLIVKTYGAIEGGNQTLGRLAEHVARMSQDQPAPAPLRLERVFDAPRDRVWAALTEAKHFARWWGPEGFDCPVCKLDLRPGGEIRVDMRGPDGSVHPMVGEYREISPMDRLVFTGSPVDGEGHSPFQVLHTMTLSVEGFKTRVSWLAVVSQVEPGAMVYLAGMEEGCKQTIDRLGRLLS